MLLLNPKTYNPESAAAVAAAFVAIPPKPQGRRWCSIVPLTFSFTDDGACLSLQISWYLFVRRPQFHHLHEQWSTVFFEAYSDIIVLPVSTVFKFALTVFACIKTEDFSPSKQPLFFMLALLYKKSQSITN